MADICYNCFQTISSGASCPHCGYDQSHAREDYPQALPLGTILNGQYILGRALGQGGFGITYVAQEYQSKKLVAVKEYLPDGMATRTGSHAVTAYSGQRGESFQYGKECFLKEAQTLAEFIGNPGIVRVHSYFEENGTAYFVMDYVEGISFQQYIRDQGGRVSWQEAKRILLPVMDALGVVHSKGIIHRDVTPDNIFITRDGAVKLLDFGAARYSLGDRSRSLDVVLKHGFAPREQYTRHGRQGSYTDVYSVAASFYYAVTGRKPPDAIDRMDEDYLALPSSLGINMPMEVEDAILKGLSVHPSDRYQRMEEFQEALTAEHPEQNEELTGPKPESQPKPEPLLQTEPEPRTSFFAAIQTALKTRLKWLVPGVGGCALLLIIVLLTGRQRGLPEDKNETNSDTSPTMLDVSESVADLKEGFETEGLTDDTAERELSVGNTSGNLSNGGQMVFSDSDIYIAIPGQGIVRWEEGLQSQLTQGDASCLNLVQNVIYYLDGNGKLCRVNTDGTGQELLVSEESYSLIVSQKVFYTMRLSSSKSGFDIYRIEQTDQGIAGEERCVVSGCYSTGSLVLDNGWLYYRSIEDYGKTIYRIPADCTGEAETFYQPDEGGYFLAAEGDWLYIAGIQTICRINLNDGSVEELLDNSEYLDGTVSGMNVLNGIIYYTVEYRPASGEQNRFRKISPEGTQEEIYIGEYGDTLGRISMLDTGVPVALVEYTDGTREDILWADLSNNDYFLMLGSENPASSQSGNLGNLNNFGFAAENENYYFFTLNDAILRVDKSDGAEELLPLAHGNQGAKYLNIYGDWIYFLDDALENNVCRVHVDGAGEEVVLSGDTRCYEMCIVNGWLYCSYAGGKLSRRQIDSTGVLGSEEIIVSDAHYYFTVDGDWVYYVSKDYSIYKIQVDGIGKELMEEDGPVVVVVDNGWLYGHTILADKNEIFRIDLESGNKEILYTQTPDIYMMNVEGLGIQDGKIYFAVINGWDEGAPEAIYRMNTDGTGLEILLANESGGFISCNLLEDQLIVQCSAGYNSSNWYYYIATDLVTGEQVRYGQ